MCPAHPTRSRRKLGRNPRPEEIRALRESYGLSQTAAAAMAYSTLRSWQNWEAGTVRMHPAIWMWWQSAAFEQANPHIAAKRFQPSLPRS